MSAHKTEPGAAVVAPGSGLTVLITGAATGFGRGATELLLTRGHSVIAAVQDAAQSEQLTAELGDHEGLDIIELDLCVSQQIAAAARWSVDVLVNNAGFGAQGPISESPIALVRKAFEVNVFGPLALTQAVLAGMRSRGTPARIVFVSSVAGLFVGPGAGGYTMSKHAVDAMAVEFQNECRGSNVEVRVFNPGPYQTGFNERLVERAPSGPEAHQRLLSNQSDPAEAIALLAGLADGTVPAERVISPDHFKDVIAEFRTAYTGIT